MSLRTEYGITNSVPFSSAAPEIIITCEGASNVLIQNHTTSGTVAYKVYVSVDKVNFTPMRVIAFKTGVETLADTAITAADGDLFQIPCTGVSCIRLTYTSGAGSTKFSGRPCFAGDALPDVSVSVAGTTDIQGNVANDAADSGNPVKIGYRAVDHGANPTTVTAGDRVDAIANRHGIPFVLGGHPNPVLISVRVLDADGAQSNVAMVTVSSGTKIAVTRHSIKADGSNAGPINGTLGFAAATLATPSTTAGAGILEDFLGISAGQGIAVGDGGSIIGIGADGEDLRYTCEDPSGGAITFSATYFTISA